jgi:hypothetical protein
VYSLKFCLHLQGVLLEVLLAFCMVNCLEFWLHLHGGLVGVWLDLHRGLLIVGFLWVVVLWQILK